LVKNKNLETILENFCKLAYGETHFTFSHSSLVGVYVEKLVQTCSK